MEIRWGSHGEVDEFRTKESVRDVIGRKIKISVKKKVKLETKGDKVDNKILNIDCYDIYLKCVFMKMKGVLGNWYRQGKMKIPVFGSYKHTNLGYQIFLRMENNGVNH
ncbi:hypothetical protein BTVI_158284 [Pitangus sulphuratus]|nr:hypothetical protein BTVI_158284 [Pitangus sulphuratus]